MQHYLSVEDISVTNTHKIVQRANELAYSTSRARSFPDKRLLMLFSASSTRTRLAFETAADLMDIKNTFITNRDSQISRGESITDTAKIVGNLYDIIAIRSTSHEDIVAFSEACNTPVINALSDIEHPTQILADWVTISEQFIDASSRKIAWLGDWNNVICSWVKFADLMHLELSIAVPESRIKKLESFGLSHSYFSDKIQLTSVAEACSNASVIMTDTWSSLGSENKPDEALMAGYQVNNKSFENATEDAIFLHCLPAYRGKEVEANIIDSEKSLVWTQAHNKLWSAIALIEHLLTVNKL